MKHPRGTTPRIAVMVLALTVTPARGQPEEDRDSTPQVATEAAIELATEAPADVGALVSPDTAPPAGVARLGAAPARAVSSLATIGLSFQGSELFVDSNSTPPDTMGAVGPNHIVQMINGRFDVYDKSNGSEVFTRTLNSFWIDVVGLEIPSGARSFDPRIVFDLATQRWFSTSIDNAGFNNVYLARSDTADPTAGWEGVRFQADTVGANEFHDYDTLSVDAQGVYVCTNDFGVFSGDESCYSVPKADILQSPPSIARMTRFEASPPGMPSTSGTLQPALDFGPSDGTATLLGVSAGTLVRTDIFASDTAAAFLGSASGISGDPGHATPPSARQPHPSGRTLENVAPRIVANVVELGESLWAVHAVRGTSLINSAVRWYEIDEQTNAVVQTGLIEREDEDYHEPSIAVNALGHVVIGYTCSGPSLAPSSCVSLGSTSGGVTTFEAPVILRLGDGHYWRDFTSPPSSERNRWGDYSATVIDPVDECTFWTFQEFVALGAVGDVGPAPLPEGGRWGIEITEIRFDGCAGGASGIDFDQFAIESYGGLQDQNPSVAIEDEGATLRLSGNGWKRIAFPYTVTPTTVIEFEFSSDVQGEVHGIGLDRDDIINNPIRLFRVYGTQAWGLADFADYADTAPGVKRYRIPVGLFYTGPMRYLTFVTDDDSGMPGAESVFSNVRVFETVVDFDQFVIESYGGLQDQSPSVAVEDEGATLRLSGNGWKRIAFPYTVTPSTVIEFEFSSDVQGEVHGIGLDRDNVINNPIRLFRVYGTQVWGLADFADYADTAPGVKRYRIPVGLFYTGPMRYLTFVTDDDSGMPGAESVFSNVRVFEE